MPEPAGGGRFALVVATGTYGDPKLKQLRAPVADAERLGKVLADPGRGGFEVEVLLDEPEAVVSRRIAGFFQERRPGDLLLLHFSCHGVKDERGELYLAAADTEVDLLSATGVSAAWLNDQITRTRSKRTVVLLDCCFSGSFPFGLRARAGTAVDAPAQLQGRGRAIITASSALEYSFEGDDLTGEGQPSIFTEAVVEGLETGHADLDGDGLVSVDDLYNYVYDRVTDRTPNQTPNKMSELEGPLYLATAPGEVAGVGVGEAVAAVLGAAVAPAIAPSARPSRRVAAFIAAAVLAVSGGVGALVAIGGGGGSGAADRAAGDQAIARGTTTKTTDASTTSAARIATPDWCDAENDPAQANDLKAERVVGCSVPDSLIAGTNAQGGAATFLRFADAGKARTAAKRSRNWSIKYDGWTSCPASATAQLDAAYDGGWATCLVQKSSGSYWIEWNDDDSPIVRTVSFDAPTTASEAVAAFDRVRSA